MYGHVIKNADITVFGDVKVRIKQDKTKTIPKIAFIIKLYV